MSAAEGNYQKLALNQVEFLPHYRQDQTVVSLYKSELDTRKFPPTTSDSLLLFHLSLSLLHQSLMLYMFYVVFG